MTIQESQTVSNKLENLACQLDGELAVINKDGSTFGRITSLKSNKAISVSWKAINRVMNGAANRAGQFFTCTQERIRATI